MNLFAIAPAASAAPTANFSEDTWWIWLIKALFIVVFLILSVIMALWVERRGLGRMQTRSGPNVLGPLGLFQALADAVKLLIKEDFWLKGADKVIYLIAPIISAFCAFSVYAVIPMGPEVSLFGHHTPLQLTDTPVAVLYILAITALGVYGLVLGGWSANSSFPILGAMRSSAQVISYELAMGLAIVTVFLQAGSLSTSQIVDSQQRLWWGLMLFPAFMIYLVSMNGEVNRLPFDLPEAEGELVAGYMTEYSSMKFGWYYLSEYINMLNVSAVATTLFFGGWRAPWPLSAIGSGVLNTGWWPMLWFIVKIWIFMFLLIWVRGTLMRMRYDHFMNLGWKVLIPSALAWFVIVAVMKGVREFGQVDTRQIMIVLGALFAVVFALLAFWPEKKLSSKEKIERARQDRRTVVDPEETFDAFAGGFPVPPLPGQSLPPSPRAGRIKANAAARASVKGELTESEKEGDNA